MSTTTTDIREAAKAGIERFLDNRGYEILDRDWECDEGVVDMVARDGETGELVFVDVAARIGELPCPTAPAADRRRREAQAARYLAAAGIDGDCTVRFDVIAVAFLGENRALVRHHINALG